MMLKERAAVRPLAVSSTKSSKSFELAPSENSSRQYIPNGILLTKYLDVAINNFN